jgi:hypothetical protein
MERERRMDDRGLEIEFWRSYRKCTGELTWRCALPGDRDAIERVTRITERFLDVPQRRPDLFGRPVLLALVAENAQGRIVDVLYLEAHVELKKVGVTRAGFEESTEIAEDLARWLKGLGFRSVWANNLPRLKKAMEKVFTGLGFECLDGKMSVWRKRL